MPDLDLTIPSTRFFQKLIREKRTIRLKTRGGDLFAGQLRWQDQECLCLVTAEGEIIFWRSSLTYVQPET